MSPVSLYEMRNALLPGLRDVVYGTNFTHWPQWKSLYVPVKPHIWVPKLTLPQAAAVGAAAAIITNPVITRRFWTGWVK